MHFSSSSQHGKIKYVDSITPAVTLTPRQRSLFNDLLGSFLHEGFESFTIDAATKRFHCSKSTVYALGHSRDEIIRRILISFFKEVTRRTEAALTAQRSPKNALERYFSAIAAALEPASPAFMRDLAREPVAREIYATNTQAATKTINELVEKGIKAGEFHSESPSFVAAITATIMEHIQCGSYADILPAPAAYHQLGSVLIHGLVRPAP